MYKIGWPSDCAATDAAIDPQVRATLLRHGNYDFMTNATHWDDSIADHALPALPYLSGKPAFFANLTWPAIGPDVTPMINTIPALERFQAMPHASYGGMECTAP